MVTKIGDGDYELTDGKAWLSAKGFSIRIHTTDEGIVVDIYKEGNEDAASIANEYILDSELDVDLPEPADDIFGDQGNTVL